MQDPFGGPMFLYWEDLGFLAWLSESFCAVGMRRQVTTNGQSLSHYIWQDYWRGKPGTVRDSQSTRCPTVQPLHTDIQPRSWLSPKLASAQRQVSLPTEKSLEPTAVTSRNVGAISQKISSQNDGASMRLRHQACALTHFWLSNALACSKQPCSIWSA